MDSVGFQFFDELFCTDLLFCSVAALRTARSTAEAALARWSNDAALWEQLSEIKQAQGDYAGAAAAAQRSLDQVPSSAACQLLHGILLAQSGKYTDAFAAFKRVVALDPQGVWARQNLALCLRELGRRDEAILELKRALILKPDYGYVWDDSVVKVSSDFIGNRFPVTRSASTGAGAQRQLASGQNNDQGGDP